MRQAIYLGAVLIGLYIVANYATGFGRDLTTGGQAGATVIKAFQGR